MSRASLCWVLALGFVLGLGGPQSAGAQSSPSSDVRRDTVALDRDGAVELTNDEGRITVDTWDRARVAYEVRPASDTSEPQPAPPLDIDHSQRQLSISSDNDSWSIKIPGLLTISPGGSDTSAWTYRVTMPETATLEIDDHASTIDVSGVNADAEIDTHAGEASVDAVEGHLTLDTYAGTATATAVQGGVTLDTHAGNISVSFRQFSDSSSAETHSGTLRFFLPADAGFELRTDLGSADMTIDSTFGTPSTKEERQVFNGGGPELFIDAFSGTVELRPRSSDEAPPRP